MDYELLLLLQVSGDILYSAGRYTVENMGIHCKVTEDKPYCTSIRIYTVVCQEIHCTASADTVYNIMR